MTTPLQIGTTPSLSSRRSSSLLLCPAAAAASRFDSRSNGVLSPLPSRLYRHHQCHSLLLRPNPKLSLLVLGVRYFGFKMWNWVCGYLGGFFERIRIGVNWESRLREEAVLYLDFTFGIGIPILVLL
ncbi:hypothetical protein AAHA92_32934 [Salvia divinorum]|uniref:Uncharacterized protein n=1 Tax=Salvia divinorum TaxID=28513 RepID=A0ABD1FMC5_SALDI